jgi:hypothetical protein
MRGPTTPSIFPSYPNLDVSAKLAKTFIINLSCSTKLAVTIELTIDLNLIIPECAQFFAALPVLKQFYFSPFKSKPGITFATK